MAVQHIDDERATQGRSGMLSCADSKQASLLPDPAQPRQQHGGVAVGGIADQLGHARVSMTQDVYMGRKALGPAGAAALESVWGTDPDASGG